MDPQGDGPCGKRDWPMNRQNERLEDGDRLPWQAIVERSRIALVVTDATVTDSGPFIVYANSAYAAATGRSAPDLIGRSPTLLHGPATDSYERRRIRDALVRAVPVRATLVNYRADGTAFDVELDIAPILDGAGVCRNFVGIARDVTDRRTELGRIKRSEEHLRLAADAGRVATWDWSVDDQELYWDKNMAAILGLPPDTTPSRELWLAALPPDDSTLMTPRYRDGGLSQRSWVQRLVRPDGEIRTVLNRATTTERDERGEPLRVTGVLIDVTEEHRAAERVVETLESLTDAYFSIDSNGRLTFVNRVAEALTGQSREQLLGKSLRETFLRFMGPTRRAQYDRCIATDEPVVFEILADILDQWIEIRVYPIPDGHAIYARDVTERHRHAAERESLLASETAARIRAEQAQAQLTFDAAHDHLTGLLNRSS